MKIFETAYTSEQLPEQNPDGLSDDVLCDINGNRETFAIGWYDFTESRWYFELRDESQVRIKDMKWQYLPLAKYDK